MYEGLRHRSWGRIQSSCHWKNGDLLENEKKNGDSCLAEEQDRNRHRLETFNKVVQEGGDGKAEMCPRYYSFCPLFPKC